MGFIEEFLQSGSIVTYKEKLLLIGWGQRSWSNTPSDLIKQSFYFPDFFLEDDKPWFTHEQTYIVSIPELKEELQ